MIRALPQRLVRRGAALLNLQCWLWGQDIRRPQGNLLLQYGAARLRPPADVSGCSQYSFVLPSGAALKLWGFGIFLGQEERGCYLNRYEFVPRLARGEDCWNASAFRGAPRHLPLEAIPDALRWIAAYEGWVQREAGARWRMEASAAGPDATGTALLLPQRWSILARDIDRWCTSQIDQQTRAAAMRASLPPQTVQAATA